MNKRNAQKLLRFLQQAGRAVSPAEAARSVALEPAPFTRLVTELETRGLLLTTRVGNLIAPEHAGVVCAQLVSQSARFSFARPQNGGADIFIPDEQLHGAMLGDLVFVGALADSSRGPSGVVARILTAGSHCFTGRTVLSERHDLLFECDAALRFAVPLRGAEGISAGEKVRAHLQYNAAGRMYATLLQTYGNASSARVCADAVLDAHNIPTAFPQDALRAAAKLANANITDEELAKRLDLRDEPVFTIDGADAKDLDDAISVHRKKDGWLLGVHIADVSHYVPANSAIDCEARRRGTSVYFADRVVPMLPEALCNGVCSLNPNGDKLAFSALIRLDTSGNILSYDFRKTVIRSKVRGVYEEVNRLFDGTADHALKEKYAPVRASLREARRLAAVLRQNAYDRGYMLLDSVESRYIISENGLCTGMCARQSGEAEQLIEQLMITANRAAALLARTHKLPFVYRVHEEPSADRLLNLRETVTRLGLPADMLTPGVTPKALSALLEAARNTKYSRVISFLLLRTMAKARYDTEPLGHYGLALDDYCHFTSPIRRYADTAVHRILSDYVNGEPLSTVRRRYAVFADEAAALASDTEVRAMTAERDTEDCYTAECMQTHLGDRFVGTVSGVTEWGLYVQLENTAEGFVAAALLPPELRYDGALAYRDRQTELTVGDTIDVRVTRADVAAGQVDFEPADYKPAPLQSLMFPPISKPHSKKKHGKTHSSSTSSHKTRRSGHSRKRRK